MFNNYNGNRFLFYLGNIIRIRCKFRNSNIEERFGKVNNIFTYKLAGSIRIFVTLIYFIPLYKGAIIKLILRTPLYEIENNREIVRLPKIITE